MTRHSIILLVMAIAGKLFAQAPLPPPEINHYQKVTSYEELSAYVKQLDNASPLFEAEVIGNSSQGRNLYALKFSAGHFGRNASKIKVIIFAQQHGNEQSGKEGALLLISELLKPEYRYLFDKIDLVLVPQVNPDGSEANRRRNGNSADLNRNHLLLTQPETQALHRLFDQYLFEVSMDVHEYSPYGGDWEKYGYRKNSDVTLGTCTNPAVAQPLRDLQNKAYLPFFLSYLRERGFSSFEYCPGGPPEVDYIRHSTFDVNDGRQSLGIQNTFSFIQEGMNGTDTYIENLRHRSEAQMTGMMALLQFAFDHSSEIKRTVAAERLKLADGTDSKTIGIQCEHVKTGEQLHIPLYSYFSGKDSLVVVNDYRPVVKAITQVQKPAGYLLPASDRQLMDWAARLNLKTADYRFKKHHRIEQYRIQRIDSIDFERDMTVDPVVTTESVSRKIGLGEYIFVPVKQLKGNMIVLALEPKSTLGLATYRDFEYLLSPGEPFPVLRLTKK